MPVRRACWRRGEQARPAAARLDKRKAMMETETMAARLPRKNTQQEALPGLDVKPRGEGRKAVRAVDFSKLEEGSWFGTNMVVRPCPRCKRMGLKVRGPLGSTWEHLRVFYLYPSGRVTSTATVKCLG